MSQKIEVHSSDRAGEIARLHRNPYPHRAHAVPPAISGALVHVATSAAGRDPHTARAIELRLKRSAAAVGGAS